MKDEMVCYDCGNNVNGCECESPTFISKTSYDFIHKAIEKQNAEQTFINELTVNDIIRKVRERMQYLTDVYNTAESPPNPVSRYQELVSLLNYIEKDAEY